MEKSASMTSITPNENNAALTKMNEVVVTSQLKSLMNNIKVIINTQLTTNTYPIWKSQMMKLFAANEFDRCLDDNITKPITNGG